MQKYCSNTCRSKAFHARKINALTTQTDQGIVPLDTPTPQQESLSLAGISNAAAGVLAVEGVKRLLTKEENKPATKKDLAQLVEKLSNRYHLIKNMNPNAQGAYPYFDLLEGKIVYLRPQ
ncbi:hypothetical protein [Winogradskyella pulchriflava]|uniref:Uncharacterized protein n=1 Tax=Winogradskyella pulchriflava TaxID=1110688 RepID=A0ABV6Q7K8_9FLAO